MQSSLWHSVTAATVILAGSSIAFASPGGYDAAADFDAANNPNGGSGVWSYGYNAPGNVLLNPFIPMANTGSTSGLDFWSAYSGGASGLPWVAHNPTASTIQYSSVTVFSGSLVLHPGPQGEYAMVRFTVPAGGGGLYDFSANFIGRDGTTTDVHLLVNSAPIYNGTVFGYGGTASSGLIQMSLVPGNTIDAVVGFGGNGYFNDSTELVFRVVPTPSAAALLGLGGLMAARRRRRA